MQGQHPAGRAAADLPGLCPGVHSSGACLRRGQLCVQSCPSAGSAFEGLPAVSLRPSMCQAAHVASFIGGRASCRPEHDWDIQRTPAGPVLNQCTNCGCASWQQAQKAWQSQAAQGWSQARRRQLAGRTSSSSCGAVPHRFRRSLLQDASAATLSSPRALRGRLRLAQQQATLQVRRAACGTSGSGG